MRVEKIMLEPVLAGLRHFAGKRISEAAEAQYSNMIWNGYSLINGSIDNAFGSKHAVC